MGAHASTAAAAGLPRRDARVGEHCPRPASPEATRAGLAPPGPRNHNAVAVDAAEKIHEPFSPFSGLESEKLNMRATASWQPTLASSWTMPHADAGAGPARGAKGSAAGSSRQASPPRGDADSLPLRALRVLLVG
jgi:hypothetical protein